MSVEGGFKVPAKAPEMQSATSRNEGPGCSDPQSFVNNDRSSVPDEETWKNDWLLPQSCQAPCPTYDMIAAPGPMSRVGSTAPLNCPIRRLCTSAATCITVHVGCCAWISASYVRL